MDDNVQSNATKFTITTRGNWCYRKYNGGLKTSLLSLCSQPPLDAECPSIVGVPGTVQKVMVDDRKVHVICVFRNDENKMRELLLYWKGKNWIDIVSTSEAYLNPTMVKFKSLVSRRNVHSQGSSGSHAGSSTYSSSSSFGNVERTRLVKIGDISFPMTESRIETIIEEQKLRMEIAREEQKRRMEIALEEQKLRMEIAREEENRRFAFEEQKRRMEIAREEEKHRIRIAQLSSLKFISFQVGNDDAAVKAASFDQTKVAIAKLFDKSPDDIDKLYYHFNQKKLLVKTEETFEAMPSNISVDIVWKTQ